LGLALCRLGRRVRFVTAAGLATQLEETQQHRLDRFLAQLDRCDQLVGEELRYSSFSRAGTELLFQVFADRYERRSLLVASNLPFGEWGQVFQGERMTEALLDHLLLQMQGMIAEYERAKILERSRRGNPRI
jgi:DNA replication protein DnaC